MKEPTWLLLYLGDWIKYLCPSVSQISITSFTKKSTFAVGLKIYPTTKQYTFNSYISSCLFQTYTVFTHLHPFWTMHTINTPSQIWQVSQKYNYCQTTHLPDLMTATSTCSIYHWEKSAFTNVCQTAAWFSWIIRFLN